jgi:CHAD domain-containing protein
MSEESLLRHGAAVGEVLRAAALAALAEGRAALDDAGRTEAVAIHDYRKGMKRWRALLRVVAPFVGEEARQLRVEARDLARELAGARDVQAALDALDDVEAGPAGQSALSPRSLQTMRARVERLRTDSEVARLSHPMRLKLRAALDRAGRGATGWDIAQLGFPDLAKAIAEGYRRGRDAVPSAWGEASPEELHTLRQRLVAHRYQIELVAPLWPRFGKLWVAEAQRLRERLGSCQDLTLLQRLTAPHGALAPWRSRLAPVIAERRAVHVGVARRLAGRLFADRPKALRRRLEALWESGAGGD